MTSDASIESTTANGNGGSSIDEDLYCLYCGYNLRGLSGNPVRCPECGKSNDRVLISVPAPIIRQALRKMETAPSMCVGVFLIAGLCGFVALVLQEPVLAALIAVSTGAFWLLPYSRMKRVFDNRIGWRGILRDFHVATACWIAPIFWMLHVLMSFRRPAYAPLLYIISYFVAPGVFVLGIVVYRNAQQRIDRLQRDKAVFMSRYLLQKD